MASIFVSDRQPHEQWDRRSKLSTVGKKQLEFVATVLLCGLFVTQSQLAQTLTIALTLRAVFGGKLSLIVTVARRKWRVRKALPVALSSRDCLEMPVSLTFHDQCDGALVGKQKPLRPHRVSTQRFQISNSHTSTCEHGFSRRLPSPQT